MKHLEQEHIKKELQNILDALNYPERMFIAPPKIDVVIAKVLDRYFLVNKINIPFKESDTPNRDYQGNPFLTAQRYMGESNEIIEAGDATIYFSDINAAIANYYAALTVDVEAERIMENREEVNSLAFTLFKAASPSNLAYAHWDQVPSPAQRQWQMVAEKAREVLAT